MLQRQRIDGSRMIGEAQPLPRRHLAFTSTRIGLYKRFHNSYGAATFF